MKNTIATFLAPMLLCAGAVAHAQVAVTTYHNDTYRTGANTQETILTPSNVNVAQFGRRAIFQVQGQVYAQPLYVPHLNINGVMHDVVYIVTEHDVAYAFDVNSGQQLWSKNLLIGGRPLIQVVPVPNTDVNCGDMTPEIGITGTPVIDLANNEMFMVAKTKESDLIAHTTKYYQTLYALDIRTGQIRIPPRRVSARVAGSGAGSQNGFITFDPLLQGQRGSLLLANGQVVVVWGSHCDQGAYHGWIMSFDELQLAPTGVWLDTPNGREGGVWGGGLGPALDSSGAIYAGTGNGTYDSNGDYGDSVVRLSWSSNGFAVADYFTPADQQNLDNRDLDLGSGGVMLLPDQPGAQYPHLLVQAGKEGTIDLVNRDGMGQFHAGDDTQIVQTLPSVIGGVWGAPAFWNNNIYFGGVNDHVKAFAYDPNTQRLSTDSISQSPESFSFPGPSPTVSSNGNSNAIVWVNESDTWRGGNAVLRAYDATNLAVELYNSEQNASRDRVGLALKFTVPTVADGHVFVGAKNQVAMYGLLQ